MAGIARHAGASLATASRALSNNPGVAAATRQRVLAVAQAGRIWPRPALSVTSPAAAGLMRYPPLSRGPAAPPRGRYRLTGRCGRPGPGGDR